MQLSEHARKRMQQRGITDLALEWLQQYGSRARCGARERILYFDKSSRRSLTTSEPESAVRRLSKQLDAYAILDGDRVLTVGHRYKRIHRY